MENLGNDSDYYLKNLVALKMTEKFYLSKDSEKISSFQLDIKDSKNNKRKEMIDMENHKYQFKQVNLANLIKTSLSR